MKNIFIPSLLVFTMLFIYVFNISKSSRLKSEFNMNIRNDYVEKLKKQIDEWDIELEKLKNAKMQKLGGNFKIGADEQISSILSQRNELKMNIDKILNSTDNGWEELKKGAEDAKEKISRAFSKAQSEFK